MNDIFCPCCNMICHIFDTYCFECGYDLTLRYDEDFEYDDNDDGFGDVDWEWMG